jgi:hypothetical protein
LDWIEKVHIEREHSIFETEGQFIIAFFDNCDEALIQFDADLILGGLKIW